jgi:hypothetical protein
MPIVEYHRRLEREGVDLLRQLEVENSSAKDGSDLLTLALMDADQDSTAEDISGLTVDDVTNRVMHDQELLNLAAAFTDSGREYLKKVEGLLDYYDGDIAGRVFQGAHEGGDWRGPLRIALLAAQHQEMTGSTRYGRLSMSIANALLAEVAASGKGKPFMTAMTMISVATPSMMPRNENPAMTEMKPSLRRARR